MLLVRASLLVCHAARTHPIVWRWNLCYQQGEGGGDRPARGEMAVQCCHVVLMERGGIPLDTVRCAEGTGAALRLAEGEIVCLRDCDW